MLLLAPVCGLASLSLLVAFPPGSFSVVRIRRPEAVLVWDALLSLAFFLQHSGMVRRRFRARMALIIPTRYHGPIYTIASGVVLIAVVVLWQRSETHLLVLHGASLWMARACSLLALAIFAFSAYTLRSFDPFGLAPIRAYLRGSPERPSTFVVRGPYRWVRHPLYSCVLVLMWSCSDLTADRLLFNILWTVWICAGTTLEEADLLAEFGEAYRDYRQKVPMFVPWRGPVAI